MLLGRVKGTVVVCVAYEGLETVPFKWVQPLDNKGEPSGTMIVCADASGKPAPASSSIYEGGREAAMALEPWFVPIDHTIIGIVDQLQTS